MDEKPVEQFRAKNDLQRHTREVQQSNEYTRVNKDFEGLCYGCFKNKYVRASIFDVCHPCLKKRGHEPILVMVGKKYHQYCFLCARFHEDITVLNARMCEKCTNTVAKAHKRLRREGRQNIDPFWRSMKKRFGKDYEILMQNPINDRR